MRESGSTRESASCTLTEKSVPVSIRPTDRFQMAISFCQPASGMPEASWWYPQLLLLRSALAAPAAPAALAALDRGLFLGHALVQPELVQL